ncbi:PilZ domain-containing protein [Geotalea toluenoxydans]|uniref:PilZ domain-containing protein n=1 Tax=Geotalea toluenoxydans TaxID=421624 RepID=UPI0006D26538|nr:PilZ domain-containing protein [Geotalea toluenoxydans]
MVNNRNFSRVSFAIDALVTQAEITIKGEVRNISLQGLYIEPDGKLDAGLPVDVSIQLSGTTPEVAIKATGSVVRVDENGIGIKFSKIDVDSFAHLRNVVSYQCGDGDKVIGEFFKYLDGQSK